MGSLDITFCGRECGNQECERNLKFRIIPKGDYYSVSLFKDCDKYIKIKESEDK